MPLKRFIIANVVRCKEGRISQLRHVLIRTQGRTTWGNAQRPVQLLMVSREYSSRIFFLLRAYLLIDLILDVEVLWSRALLRDDIVLVVMPVEIEISLGSLLTILQVLGSTVLISASIGLVLKLLDPDVMFATSCRLSWFHREVVSYPLVLRSSINLLKVLPLTLFEVVGSILEDLLLMNLQLLDDAPSLWILTLNSPSWCACLRGCYNRVLSSACVEFSISCWWSCISFWVLPREIVT